MFRPLASFTAFFMLLVVTNSSADDATFESEVRAIFSEKCGKCHSGGAHKAGLRLEDYASIKKGGESGEVVVPGKLDESLLWEMVHDQRMPPESEPQLSDRERKSIRVWIASGARSSESLASEWSASEASIVAYLDVIPVMLRRCVMCHGGQYQRGGVDLRTYASLAKLVEAGSSQTSVLMQRVVKSECPPSADLGEAGIEPMTLSERALVSKWIDAGADDTRLDPDVATDEDDAFVSDADREFWSLKPVADPQVPTIAKMEHHPLDGFVQRGLVAQDLSIAEPAEREILARRAAYALTGLPLSPDERIRFLEDARPGAFERLVDRLMSSPHYGEKWGRFWLDLAGYSDSEGKRSADMIRPYAWRYRDWVIRAMNDDMPFDQFLIEQLAGDELVDWGAASDVSDETVDKLIATGFLRMVPDGTSADPVNRLPDRMEVISDTIDVFSRSILGLTMNCARCHTHKYDPIPQRDYYRMAAIFKGAYDEYDWMTPQPFGNQWKDAKRRFLEVMPAHVRAQVEVRDADLQQRIAELKQQSEQAEKAETKKLAKEIKALEAKLGTGPKIRALWDRGRPSPTFVYRRGDEMQPASLVGPGVPAMLTDGLAPFTPVKLDHSTPKTGRRLALARWLTQKDHPLTSRVFVNRVWHQHFGRGIVESLDNFGRLGTPPSHPELLDYLARDFVEHGWSLKRLNRQIVLSAVWSQPSEFPLDSARIGRDPENRWFSRMPMRRLSAEELRDSLLVVAGRLDRRPLGEPDPVEIRGDGLVTSKSQNGMWRRSIYLRQRRKEMPTIFETFDLPQMNPNCAQRKPSTVVSQPLHLLNNKLVRQWAENVAQRVLQAAGNDLEKQATVGFQYLMGRPPTSDEHSACVDGLGTLRNSAGNEVESVSALVSYCHALMNTAGFLYVD